LGRKRVVKNGPRAIDLDLLLFGDEVINETGLQVPHPKLQDRWFVLKPLWDLRADLVHPVLEKSVCELLSEVDAGHKKPQKI
jgi:7,8-dihydro-6-hydroxymethylpterin-pyrophosphokinase